MQQFRKALNAAFDEPSMELLISDYFAPNSFSKLTPPGYNKTFEYRLQELINQARMNDWLLDLVAAARERRSKNAALTAIATDRGLTIAGPRLDNPTGKPLEALVQEHAKFIDPSTLWQRLAALEGQVCWVGVPGGGGTGFLVGADLVLTNQHVIAPVENGLAMWQDVRCRFDYREPVDAEPLVAKKPTQVGLATQWLVHSRPPSDLDWNPALGDPAPDEVDAALIRLNEPVGELSLGGPSADPGAQPRGWIQAAQPPPAVAAGNQLFLLQHPKGEPLRLTIGTIRQFNQSGTRVRHDANSKDGSSGSPCFDANLQLVALHHARDPDYPPAWNQAVPMTVIQQVWQTHGVKVG